MRLTHFVLTITTKLNSISKFLFQMDNTTPKKHLFKQMYEMYFLNNQHINAAQSKTSFDFIAIVTQFDSPFDEIFSWLISSLPLNGSAKHYKIRASYFPITSAVKKFFMNFFVGVKRTNKSTSAVCMFLSRYRPLSYVVTCDFVLFTLYIAKGCLLYVMLTRSMQLFRNAPLFLFNSYVFHHVCRMPFCLYDTKKSTLCAICCHSIFQLFLWMEAEKWKQAAINFEFGSIWWMWDN